MNIIGNEIQLWYFGICDKTTNNESKSKHIISKSHTHRQKIDIVVKQYEFIQPDFDEVNCILNDTINGCKKK